MFTLVYVISGIVALLPWSYLVKLYGIHINLKRILKEANEISKELKSLPESKVKKKRILVARYKEIRGKISKFVMINVLLLWVGVIGSLLFSRISVLAAAVLMNRTPYIPSPLELPWISQRGYLNDIFLYLAILLAYIPIHNRISGMKIVHEWSE